MHNEAQRFNVGCHRLQRAFPALLWWSFPYVLVLADIAIYGNVQQIHQEAQLIYSFIEAFPEQWVFYVAVMTVITDNS